MTMEHSTLDADAEPAEALSSRFDETNPAKIVPLLSEPGDSDLLRQWIENKPQYEVLKSSDLTAMEFDLAVIDIPTLERFQEELYSRKEAAAPVLLPFLLLLPENKWTAVTESDGPVTDSVLKGTVDEVVSLPLKKAELGWRVESLLRLRSQSLEMRRNELQLRKFKEAADSAGYAIYMTDENGSITYVNPTFEAVTGYSRTEVLGENPRILQSGEMSETYYEDLWETISAGDVWKEELTNRKKNGDKYEVKQTIAPIVTDTGEVKSYVAIQVDITEKKRRERDLQQFKQAVESSNDLLAAVDEDCTYLFANEQYRDYHGIGPVDITEYTLADVLGESTVAALDTKLNEVLEGAEVKTEVTRTHPEMGDRTLDVQYFPLKGEANQIQGIATSMRDVTSQKRLEADLEATKDRYQALFNSIQDAIVVVDPDREIINCNSAFSELFGYGLAEIRGKSAALLFEDEQEYEHFEDAIKWKFGDPQASMEATFLSQSGTTFPGETNVFYLRDTENEIAGLIGVIRDVSERKNRLKQLQAVDRVLQHNFHNEINVIQGFAKQIENEGDQQVSKYARKISDSGEQLLRTVDNERKTTKFLSDPSNPELINVQAVCETVVDGIRATHPAAAISTTYEEYPELTVTSAIEAAIEELVLNAITHSSDPAPEVQLTVSQSDVNVIIGVKDQNPRIPKMERKVISGEEELTPLFHGSGMGLWLVWLITDHADGTLQFEENEPKGNIVSLVLPQH